MRETWVRSLGREDPLEKAMATHSSILAWKIPWMEEPGRLQSMGSQRVRHDWATSLFWGVTPDTSFFCLKLISCLLSPSDEPLSKCHVNFEESTFNSMLAWAKTIIHPSVHNHLLPVIHHFLNKWKVSFKTYEHHLYLRTNVCPFSSC